MNDNFCVRLPSFRRGSVGDRAIVEQIEKKYKLHVPVFENIFIEQTKNRDTLLYICCDCLGYYDVSVDGINNFIKRNKPVHLLNTSWGSDVKSTNASYLKSIQQYDKLHVYCRDKFSHDLMSHEFNFAKKPILTSDIAHACVADDTLSDVRLQKWINASTDPIIGINIHQLFGIQNKNVEHGVINFIQDHIDEYRFVFIPHDTRVFEHKYLNYICDKFPAERCRLNTVLRPGHIQLLTKKLYMVITCRMHLSIFALSNNTPCIGISYNGCKTNGTYSHWNMDDYVIPPDKIELLRVMFNDIKSNYNNIVDMLVKLSYNIRQLAELQLNIK